MFLESLLESSPHAKSRRGWSTLTSFLIEALAIGVLVLAPLLYTQALPSLTWISSSLIGPPAGEWHQPPSGDRRPAPKPQPVIDAGDRVIRAPGYVPVGVHQSARDEITDEVGTPCTGVCVPGGTGTGGNGTLLNHVLETVPKPEPKRPPTESRPVPISHIDEGMLIRRVQPVYPPLAIATRTQGTVVLHAIIGRDGVIRQVEALSGHPLLIPAAVDAVRQWRYRPYYLGGQPVEVETSVTVNFVLGK